MTNGSSSRLDQRTDEQRENDACAVWNLAYEARPPTEPFGARDVANYLAEWIAADQGRLDAFLADHPEGGA